MAANDELPRGITLTNSTLANNTTITLPACPDISWVVTSITAVGSSGYAGQFSLNIAASTINGGNAIDYDNGDAVNAFDAIARCSWTGTSVAPSNTAVTVTVTQNGGANPLNTVLIVEAYPI